MQRLIALAILSIVLLSCEIHLIGHPPREDRSNLLLETHYGHTGYGTRDTISYNPSSVGWSNPEVPTSPYEISYTKDGVAHVVAYVGVDWGVYKYYLRNDKQLGGRVGSELWFPARGGVVYFDIVNYYTDLSLYADGYGFYSTDQSYYFIEEGQIVGNNYRHISSRDYKVIHYQLVVNPAKQYRDQCLTSNAHWTSTEGYQQLGELNITLFQAGIGNTSVDKIELVDM